MSAWSRRARLPMTAAPSETPPRAWGRHSFERVQQRQSGNTPTGVGKTRVDHKFRALQQKHPHGRGEDVPGGVTLKPDQETPPRAWGRPARWSLNSRASRNTPTGVGKTPPPGRPPTPVRKHPHGRGEDLTLHHYDFRMTETPPRAWGRHPEYTFPDGSLGNTPTGVGKTDFDFDVELLQGKHPHGRGEDTALTYQHWCGRETPPRAWGRHSSASSQRSACRNTPTGVGKTGIVASTVLMTMKHPHGRGEDLHIDATCEHVQETPPRAWGRRSPSTLLLDHFRNTPTGVGKTAGLVMLRRARWKHPHGRGEDSAPPERSAADAETPPRA